MILIRHRRNTSAELANTPITLGIEVDIRSPGSRLIIHHDPFTHGEDFEDWLEFYAHRLLILNVKEEGLEDRVLDLMAARGISDFFFLDQSFPFLMRTARQGEKRCAIRVSEYESVETALRLAGQVNWVWVDCFAPGLSLSAEDGARLAAAGFKLCLVSPELQGRDPAEIQLHRRQLDERRIIADAICTKLPEHWLAKPTHLS